MEMAHRVKVLATKTDNLGVFPPEPILWKEITNYLSIIIYGFFSDFHTYNTAFTTMPVYTFPHIYVQNQLSF